MVPDITSTGLTAVEVGPDLDFIEYFTGGLAEEAASEKESVTANGATARFADAAVDDLVAFGRSWRPDVVVHEPLNLAAPIAARVLNVPAVQHLWAADFSQDLPVDEDVATGDFVRRSGLDRLPDVSDLILDPCPPAMQVPPCRAPRQPIRFVPYNGVAEHPSWLWEPPTRPRVCVTWGTLMSEADDDDLYRAPRVVDALAASGVEVVVAADPKSRPRFGALPENVRFADGPLALHVVLPTCQAVVHQGGAGSTMTALAAGVPQVIVPAVVDQQFNAERLALTGAGVAGEVATIASTVDRLLSEPRWREAAAELAEHNATRPSPAEIAAELPRLLNLT